jgi:membrane fusion protein (multidrug efflux system)
MEINIKISDAWARKLLRAISGASKDAPPTVRKAGTRLLLIAIAIIVVMGGWKWFRNHQEGNARAEEIAAGPRVNIAHVTKSKPEYTVTVIGEARPFAEVTLYAKVSGYLKSVKVDKGDNVKSGQILAVIDSPETDESYNAAAAESKNKGKISERMDKLAERSLVSPQEVEQAKSDADVARARLESLQRTKGFETLRAPFDGTVTARFADAGSLVQNATNAQSGALPVVTVSQLSHLRIYAYLDQKDARYVRTGDQVEITQPDHAGFRMQAAVTRQSGTLDEKTRMLLTEVDVDNTKGEIVPGSYVQVSLRITRPAFLETPVEALVIKDGISYLPIITADKTIHYTDVALADNDGRTVSIRTGVSEGDLVALNVGPVPEAGKVRPIEAAAVPATTPAKPEEKKQ